MTWLLLVGLVVLLALNVPVAYAMLGVSILYLVLRQDIPLIVVAQQVAAGTDKFLLLAIPFFFLAAEFMSSGGVMQRLVDFARALVGHLRGGLGQMNVVASMFFAGISGSAVADAAGPGKHRDRDHAPRRLPARASPAAITAASATIGPIIPPSIPLVVYGSIANVSVGTALPRRLRARPADGPVPDGRGVVARRPAQLPAHRWAGGRALARSTSTRCRC